MKKFKIFLLIFLFLIILTGFWFFWNIQPVICDETETANEKLFVIKKGENTNLIIERLKEAGLIRNSLSFNLLLYQKGLVGKIQAGDFRLSSIMNAVEIAQALTHGTLDYWVTLIEGWRVEEVAQELNSKLKTPNSKFISEAKDKEGYLFPDTYLVPQDASPTTIIKILRENFDRKFEDLQLDLNKIGLTRKQVIILASLLEREVKQQKDRSLIAGILIKRWQNDWPLQIDATVQYALGRKGDWWPKVSKADLTVDSSYNTYKYSGLPPGPICNPGLASIKAVINSQESDYWFYLSDEQGQMHYSKTNEEHNNNKRKYL